MPKALEEKLTGVYHLGGPTPMSLHEIGLAIIKRGGYDPTLLKGMVRKDEINGPPRMGDVSLSSKKICADLGIGAIEEVVW